MELNKTNVLRILVIAFVLILLFNPSIFFRVIGRIIWLAIVWGVANIVSLIFFKKTIRQLLLTK